MWHHLGLPVNSGAAVLDGEPTLSQALLGASELVGGLFYHNYPGGIVLSSGAVLGRIAGRAPRICTTLCCLILVRVSRAPRAAPWRRLPGSDRETVQARDRYWTMVTLAWGDENDPEPQSVMRTAKTSLMLLRVNWREQSHIRPSLSCSNSCSNPRACNGSKQARRASAIPPI